MLNTLPDISKRERTCLISIIEPSISCNGYLDLSANPTATEIKRAAIGFMEAHLGSNWGRENIEGQFGPEQAVTLYIPSRGCIAKGDEKLSHMCPSVSDILHITVPARVKQDLPPERYYQPPESLATFPDQLLSPLLASHNSQPEGSENNLACDKGQLLAAEVDKQSFGPQRGLSNPKEVASMAGEDILRKVEALLEEQWEKYEKQQEAQREKYEKQQEAQWEKYEKQQEAQWEKYEKQQEEISNLKKDNEERARILADVQAQLNEVLDDAENVHGWISAQDTDYMDSIRIRHLLQIGEAYLASQAGLLAKPSISSSTATQSSINESRLSQAWRSALAEKAGSDDHPARTQAARDILGTCNLDPMAQNMLKSEGILKLLTNPNSKIRRLGNRSAHPLAYSKRVMLDSIGRLSKTNSHLRVDRSEIDAFEELVRLGLLKD